MYRFIVRSLQRPLHIDTTGDISVKTSTVMRLHLRPLESLSQNRCPLAKAAKRSASII